MATEQLMKTLIKQNTEVTALQRSNEKNVTLLQQFALRLINAQEEERHRIAQEMHDDIGNRIALIAMSLRQITNESPDNFSSSRHKLNEIFDQITDLSTTLRDLSHGLHPPLLRHAGIKAALKSLQEKFVKARNIQMDLVVGELPRLPAEVALCIFRITQESLQNVARHSGADRVTVVLDRTFRGIRLTVADKGRGFIPSRAIRKDGLGLLSMEARALYVGGRLTMKSSPGAGTEIRLTIPLQGGVSRIRVI